MKPKIIIAGGNGYLGKLLANHWGADKYDIVILTRKPCYLKNTQTVLWNGVDTGDWVTELEGAFALINFAGRSVDCRYTEKNKKEIIQSRVKSTHALGIAVQGCKNPPQVWLNASSATIYPHSEKEKMTEAYTDFGNSFSDTVCKVWEETFFAVPSPATRKAALRIALVMGNNGGAFPVLKKLAQFGLGGKMGKGTQYISWIHEQDFCRAIDYVLNQPIEGAVNISAPQPETNQHFMESLRQGLGKRFGINHPRWLLELGAILLQTETELILKSRNVVPQRLLKNGFEFEYPSITEAFKSLLKD